MQLVDGDTKYCNIHNEIEMIKIAAIYWYCMPHWIGESFRPFSEKNISSLHVVVECVCLEMGFEPKAW